MPIDPFLALNAMIRAEVTRAAEPTAGHTAGPAARTAEPRDARTYGARAQARPPVRAASADSDRKADSRTDDAG